MMAVGFTACSLCSFVMHGTGGVIFMDPGGGHGEVGTPAGFVAQTPHHHGGVVAVTDHKALRTVHPGC